MSAIEDAWQATLAAEQRAVFGYGLLGAQLHGSPHLALAITCSDGHEALRDATAAAISAAGSTPVPPAADYPDLYPVSTPQQAVALAPRLEDDCAAAWRYLYAVAAAESGAAGGRSQVKAQALRSSAQSGLTASAVRATRWRKTLDPSAATVAFPGL